MCGKEGGRGGRVPFKQGRVSDTRFSAGACLALALASGRYREYRAARAQWRVQGAGGVADGWGCSGFRACALGGSRGS